MLPNLEMSFQILILKYCTKCAYYSIKLQNQIMCTELRIIAQLFHKAGECCAFSSD